MMTAFFTSRRDASPPRVLRFLDIERFESTLANSLRERVPARLQNEGKVAVTDAYFVLTPQERARFEPIECVLRNNDVILKGAHWASGIFALVAGYVGTQIHPASAQPLAGTVLVTLMMVAVGAFASYSAASVLQKNNLTALRDWLSTHA